LLPAVPQQWGGGRRWQEELGQERPRSKGKKQAVRKGRSRVLRKGRKLPN